MRCDASTQHSWATVNAQHQHLWHVSNVVIELAPEWMSGVAHFVVAAAGAPRISSGELQRVSAGLLSTLEWAVGLLVVAENSNLRSAVRNSNAVH